MSGRASDLKVLKGKNFFGSFDTYRSFFLTFVYNQH